MGLFGNSCKVKDVLTPVGSEDVKILNMGEHPTDSQWWLIYPENDDTQFMVLGPYPLYDQVCLKGIASGKPYLVIRTGIEVEYTLEDIAAGFNSLIHRGRKAPEKVTDLKIVMP